MTNKHCCGNCKFGKEADDFYEFICAADNSDHTDERMEFMQTCDNWESKDE